MRSLATHGDLEVPQQSFSEGGGQVPKSFLHLALALAEDFVGSLHAGFVLLLLLTFRLFFPVDSHLLPNSLRHRLIPLFLVLLHLLLVLPVLPSLRLPDQDLNGQLLILFSFLTLEIFLISSKQVVTGDGFVD